MGNDQTGRVAPAGIEAEWCFTAKVQVSAPVEMGEADGGRRRFIPIDGGSVSGPMLEGEVLPGGADWQTVDPDGVTRLEAHYAIRANDGTVIEIVNPGLRVAAPDVSAALARGEPVSADRYYFRTTPRFMVTDGPHDWMRRTIFVATGIRTPDEVVIHFFKIC